ncbi:hypothetical protein GGI25_000351 [Coemansia spiralis]|uniref:Late endosomal/lysosomal adaptor and MAPK and MTOR activator 5 n=2 Tax=Coemansia TaxID=4863 RepID=A0A9W8GC71_9FUNG|nr:hypothetical protein BX070DRAFT_221552 [Coemansia spiralis]KAJ1996288.1 hypothetical protein EDC05_000178 [Coemansia umbellata]KAJ2625954.1 hypothetical protein GGI26_000038 [Coemansia sp. RSA 1358]KAJ2680716.1 hypothetical protein GGI25_000351 [Coemansia spiralis]
MMEAKIDELIKSVYDKDPDVTGIVIVDESGLCLAMDGDMTEPTAGLVASIASRAETVLSANSNLSANATPVVQIEAESAVITIRRILGVTVGILKENNA